MEKQNESCMIKETNGWFRVNETTNKTKQK